MTTHDGDPLAEGFEANRAHLRAVAFRMLGSVTEADDAVQEAWIRLSRADAAGIENLQAWLTTVVARVCLDLLRARSRSREQLVDPHIPDPVVGAADGRLDPEQEVLLADSVGLALMVVLETLTPAERLAFVLHDMFAIPFDEIAAVAGRTPAATRQLASRARRRVRGAAPAPDADVAQQRQVVDAFLAAARSGDFDALVRLLDPDVVVRIDRGVARPGQVRELHGAEAVAQTALRGAVGVARFARPALVNGAAGLVLADGDRRIAVAGFTVVGGRIAAVDLLADRARLRALDLDL
jgi:RNA polymerase sigma-70 factor (ECF subfamily)